ncbi:Uncharacterized protein SCF082_LOCUS19933, partial [Durusdinium trenchii]
MDSDGPGAAKVVPKPVRQKKGEGAGAGAADKADAPPPEPHPVKRRRVSRNSDGSGANSSKDEKKCKRCKKLRLVSDFYQGQANCAECSTKLRTIRNIAKRSQEVQWLDSLDDSQLDTLLAAYTKEHEAAKKERCKCTFNLTLYKEKSIRAAGVRKEVRKRMMSEECFYDFAKGAQGGSLSSTQAQRKWAEYLADPNTVQEGEGSTLKLSIPIATDIIDYDDISKQKELERQQKLSKLNEAQYEGKVDALVLGGGRPDCKMNGAKTKAALADDSDLVLPTLSDLAAKTKAKAKEAAEGEDEARKKDPADSEAEGDTKWFDSVAQQAKAARQFSSKLAKSSLKMVAMIGQMEVALDSARGSAGATSAGTEMRILDNRLKALRLIKDAGAEEFRLYVAELHSKSQAAKSAETVSHSSAADHHLAQAEELKAKFNSVTAQEELNATWKEANRIMCHWEELLSACRTAVSELKRATEVKSQGQGGRGKNAKAKAKAKGRAARATSMYEVFSYDKSTAIDVYDVCPLSADRVMDTPFILTAVPSIMEKLLALKEPSADAPDATKVYQELTSFHEKFARSDLRFTTGKAQRPMKEAVGQVVSTALRGSLSGHEVVDAGHWLPPRKVILADPEKIVTLLTDQNHKLKEEDREKVTYASAVAFLTHATPKDLEDLGGGIWQGTLKPGQLLWTPAGMIAGEQTSESDHLGLKVSLVAVGETGDSRGIATLRKMQMEGKDLNKKSDVLDEILLAVDAKQSDLKLKAAPPTEESQ